MSESPPLDPEEILRRVVEAGRHVKFGRGLIGKTSHAVIALIGLWVLIVWKLGPDLMLDGVLLAAGALVTGVVVWWVGASQKFAEKHPAQAMLEGSELLEYQRFEAQAKGGVPGRGGSALIGSGVIRTVQSGPPE